MTFVDLYAGCGGLSLGLMRAGMRGVFAVEKEHHAFSTLEYNFLAAESQTRFEWPAWLPQEPIAVEALLRRHMAELKRLEGKVSVLAGGPPCQGFSSNGRRIPTDPRNQAFRAYLRVVDAVRPEFVLMENVRGITQPFEARGGTQTSAQLVFSELIRRSLEKPGRGYKVWTEIVDSTAYGVPQSRPRFILVACREEISRSKEINPFEILREILPGFLKQRHLKPPVSAREALSDLCRNGQRLFEWIDSKGYKHGGFGTQVSTYQRLLHGDVCEEIADSHRFVKHRQETTEVFRWLQKNCGRGKGIRPKDRGKFKKTKHRLYILDPALPAATVTTQPDDILHYVEPRVLTVREMARLQSFPDSFQFKGKYSTGGKVRILQCPRYTQVANAVPPLLAEAMGEALIVMRNRIADAE